MTDYNIDFESINYAVEISPISYVLNYEQSAILGQEYFAGEGLNLLSKTFSIEPARLAKIDAITLDAAGTKYLADDGTYKILPPGETNTASNLAGGEGLFAQKVDVDLQFKSLVAGTNVSLSADSNTITVNVPTFNPFNQDLNTTNSVTFDTIEITSSPLITSGSSPVFSVQGVDNVLIGFNAGSTNSGSGNIAIGTDSGQSNTGDDNVFIGSDSGRLSTGRNSVAIGELAGESHTGANNLILGTQAGRRCSGGDNVLIGAECGVDLASNSNVMVGKSAGRNTGSASFNVFIGLEAGKSNDGADFNTYVGAEAGELNEDGTRNTFIGRNSGKNNKGSFNSLLGYESGSNNISGNQCVFVGYRAGYNETGTNKLYITNNLSGSWLYGDMSGIDYRVGINTTTLTNELTINGSVDVTSGNSYKVNDTQVLTSQQSAIADLAGGATLTDTINKVNAILAMNRTHGFIAA